VALTAMMYTFDVQLMDVDRGVYETLDLRVAQHPSETDEYMVTRVLAYCLEYTEGIGFSKGIADPDEPAITVRDLTGAVRVWIDIGAPDAVRLHKASKAAAPGLRTADPSVGGCAHSPARGARNLSR
jgi:uncharacterized protein YaeQ